jgi:hypothetical protein
VVQKQLPQEQGHPHGSQDVKDQAQEDAHVVQEESLQEQGLLHGSQDVGLGAQEGVPATLDEAREPLEQA